MQQGLAAMEQLVRLLAAQLPTPPAGPPKDLLPSHHRFMVVLCDPADYTYEQMAGKLGISLNTVHSHRAMLFELFGVKSKVGLVQLGRSWGLGGEVDYT